MMNGKKQKKKLENNGKRENNNNQLKYMLRKINYLTRNVNNQRNRLLIHFIITKGGKPKLLSHQITLRFGLPGSKKNIPLISIITMEIAHEYPGFYKDEDIYKYFKHHWSNLFPRMPHRTNFVRQCANLWKVKEMFLNIFPKIKESGFKL